MINQAGMLCAWWEIEAWCELQAAWEWASVGMTSIHSSLVNSIVRPRIIYQAVHSSLEICRGFCTEGTVLQRSDGFQFSLGNLQP